MADRIGILHPGDMGISVAAAAMAGGNEVYWASEGRSPETRARAEGQSLRDARSVRALVERCEVILSVCPPDAAEAVAEEVLGHGFQGLLVDANAISPVRAVRIGERLRAAGADFVDGGIIGGPAWQRGTTWLCLSGAAAKRVARCFEGGPLEIEVLDGPVGRASALKMCYAAYTKGTTALLGAIMGAAENLGVRGPLYGHWARNGASFIPQSEKRVNEGAVKAWRWVGEMEEISSTLAEAGMPAGFHLAAAEFYRHLAGFKGAQSAPTIESVLAALSQTGGGKPT